MDEFELPIVCHWEADGWVVRIPVNLDLGIAGQIVKNIPFRIDSGSDCTHIPTRLLPGLSSVQFPVRRRIAFRSASGTGNADLVDFSLAFTRFRAWTFHARGLLNPHIPHGLLAFRDLVSNWALEFRNPVFRRSVYDQRSSHTGGSVRLTLLRNHHGIAMRLE